MMQLTFRKGRQVHARLQVREWGRERELIDVSHAFCEHPTKMAVGPVIHTLDGFLDERVSLEEGSDYRISLGSGVRGTFEAMLSDISTNTFDHRCRMSLLQRVKTRGKPGPKAKPWDQLAESTRRRKEREWARIDAGTPPDFD